jgi:hypothetical protein
MASGVNNYRLNQAVLDADRAAILSVQSLADYAPRNSTHSAEALREFAAQLAQAEQIEKSIRQSLEEARAASVRAGWMMHNALLGAKAEVRLQYGDDSFTVQTVGLTRRSDRKRTTRTAAK